MKKLFYILFAVATALLLSVSFSSCKKSPKKAADEQIQKTISGLTFPQELRNGNKLLDMSYKDNVLTFSIEIDKDKLEALDTDSLKALTVRSLKGGLFPHRFVEDIIIADAKINYIFLNGNDSVTIPIAASELQ